jgi:hypothetical protein
MTDDRRRPPDRPHAEQLTDVQHWMIHLPRIAVDERA